jgi:hypothetical protein
MLPAGVLFQAAERRRYPEHPHSQQPKTKTIIFTISMNKRLTLFLISLALRAKLSVDRVSP